MRFTKITRTLLGIVAAAVLALPACSDESDEPDARTTPTFDATGTGIDAAIDSAVGVDAKPIDASPG
jgi:hypothetical protein